MIPEGTNFWGVVLKQVLLGFMAFTVGVSIYRAIYHERKRHHPFLVTAFLGIVLLMVPLAPLIIRAPIIDPTWQAIVFLTGLLLIGVGFLGDAIRDNRYRRK
jgi:uncharacterized membrane protein YoaK (UPF0700 family)